MSDSSILIRVNKHLALSMPISKITILKAKQHVEVKDTEEKYFLIRTFYNA